VSVRVRFAPSPTGYLHVGGARTALFDWLFARKHGGTFILRIEDTDVERSTEESTQGILEAMKWLGLGWDEGPYFQSQRLEQHQSAVRRLIESGDTYYCFCAPDTLERKRQEAAAKKIDFKYDRTCLSLPPEEVKRRLAAGERAAVRFRVPEGAITFRDEVIGDITIESNTIEDFVLLRSNSQPTYHVGVVVDDIDMGITHVIRGTEHISNTPKQILLYRALKAPIPSFGHVPMILGPDKTKLSKRHGATSVMTYAEQGIVPEALRNFLALLGWSPGNDQEIFDDQELIQAFSLQGISKANAVFNPEKLAWFNAQYLAKLPHERLVQYLKPEFTKAGLWRDSFEKEQALWFRSLVDLFRPRAKVLQDFPRQARMFIADDVEMDPAAVAKFLKDSKARENLRTLASRLEGLSEFSLQSTESLVRGLANELGIKAGELISPVRVALTGQTASPGIFDVITLLGREKTVSRLRRVAESVPAA
jgi:glutamyl-tRNA synthetase